MRNGMLEARDKPLQCLLPYPKRPVPNGPAGDTAPIASEDGGVSLGDWWGWCSWWGVTLRSPDLCGVSLLGSVDPAGSTGMRCVPEDRVVT